MDKLKGQSLDITTENINRLKKLFPEIVTEGKIDFDALRVVLGDEVDTSKEKYQFTWNGKSESIKLAQTPSTATLRPCNEKSKNWDATNNLYIEGDNLEVLKLLQKTYYGRIKMIYIDPPYNTGNDFVYKDDFKNSIDNYKEQTNQTQRSNPDTSGRFHSDWLNLIYPRLILARNILSNDGVIFISIDDHEQDNLRKICNEVFGESNFIGQIVWQRRTSPDMRKLVSTAHDYIIVYAKNANNISSIINKVRLSEADAENYKNPDNDPRGPWASSDFTAQGYRPNQMYEITTPGGAKYTPPEGRCWKNVESEFLKQCEEGRMWFGKDGMGIPRRKTYLSEREGKNVWTWWPNSEVGHTQEATQEVKNLFSGHQYFDYPKPVRLIKKLIQIGTHDDSIVMDFFSGSGTTAHALMALNSEDVGKRKFILVQLPEIVEKDSDAGKAGFKTICDIGQKRVELAGTKIEEDNPLLTGDLDFGFKVFKLDSTNINPWDNAAEYDENTIYNSATVFKLDRTKEDILYEIMLKYGVFDQPVSEVNVNGKKLYRIGQRHMIVCLEDNIDDYDVSEICKLNPRVVVFKEEGFKDDNAKINAEYNLKLHGVEDIKCV